MQLYDKYVYAQENKLSQTLNQNHYMQFIMTV